MYKVEYEIERDENGSVIIKFSNDFQDLPQHKLLFFIMSSHLLNMGKQLTSRNDDLEDERVDGAIELLNEIAHEINMMVITEDVEIQQKKVDSKGIVTNTVNNYKELISFKLGDTYNEENNLEVQEGTTFYNIKDKKKYCFINNKWEEYKKN